MDQQLVEALAYEPISGLLTWRRNVGHVVQAGDIAGSFDKKGYVQVGFQGKTYRGHRLAWFLKTGVWPACHIDHKNLIKSDNRWENLRQATNSQNAANTRALGGLPKGVTRHKGKYQAQIQANGRNHYLGLFASPADAHGAYMAAAKVHFGEFARAS